MTSHGTQASNAAHRAVSAPPRDAEPPKSGAGHLPSYTSKTCHDCGVVLVHRSRMRGSRGEYYCGDCGRKRKAAKALVRKTKAFGRNVLLVAIVGVLSAGILYVVISAADRPAVPSE